MITKGARWSLQSSAHSLNPVLPATSNLLGPWVPTAARLITTTQPTESWQWKLVTAYRTLSHLSWLWDCLLEEHKDSRLHLLWEFLSSLNLDCMLTLTLHTTTMRGTELLRDHWPYFPDHRVLSDICTRQDNILTVPQIIGNRRKYPIFPHSKFLTLYV